MRKKTFHVVITVAILGLVAPVLAQPGKGFVLFEYYDDIGDGTAVADLRNSAKFPDNPDRSEWLKSFFAPAGVTGGGGVRDNYGIRGRAYVVPPQTGDYTFWVSGDDGCELWLSTDDSPANARLIAEVTGWTPAQAWDGAGGSTDTTRLKSTPIPLEAGKRYYIEGLMKEAGGGESIGVAWGGPGIGAGPVLLDGKYCFAVLRDPEPMFLPRNPSPADGATGVTMLLMQWQAGATAFFHDVYFGTEPDPPKVSTMQTHLVYYNPLPIEPGRTYYWKVEEIESDGVTRHIGPVWTFSAEPLAAYEPTPDDGAAGVLPGLILTWRPGKGAARHQVYFGPDMAAVANGDASVDQGELEDPSFNTGALRASSTYYWRVDTVTLGGDVETGHVWSFTTADAGPVNKIVYENWMNISGTAIVNLTGDPNYPHNPDTVEYIDSFQSRVDWADNYGNRLWGWLKPPATGDYTFWIAGDDQQELHLSTDGSPANATVVATVPGWTPALDWDNTGGGSGGASQMSAPIPLVQGEKYFIMALGKEGGGGDSTAVAWQGPGIEAREVIKGQYVDAFYLAPLQAFGPSPSNRQIDVVEAPDLSWNAGEQAQTHDVYFGDDEAAVAAADTASPLFKGNQTATTYDLGTLEWDKTFYWRIDEVGAAESWKGNVWSFTTANFIPVDDFESYNDDEGTDTRIYENWLDGWTTNDNGSTVGNWDPPFAEQSIVHGGRQSMPFDYNNVNAPFYSQAYREFAPVQDWTVNGVTDLTLFVRGYPPRFVDDGGVITMSAQGADIYGGTDEFRFAYKPLNGNGSITLRVDDVRTVNAWTKAGVMIRSSLEPLAMQVHMINAAQQNLVEWMYRSFNFDTVTTQFNTPADSTPLPVWLRLTRAGDVFTGEYSTNGTTWSGITQADGTTSSITLTMPPNVYVGIVVCSHTANVSALARFSQVQTGGGVSGAWKTADIGVVHPGNDVQPLYVIVEDSTGQKATATNPDPAAVNVTDWTEWKVPLTDLAGANLTRVKRLYIGVGDKSSAGYGKLYIDDIRVTKPAPPAPEPAE